jgi:hypothetical protein
MRPRGETTIRSLIIVMVGVGLGYIVTNPIWVVVMIVVIWVMVGGVMIIWVAVIIDLLDVRLDDRLDGRWRYESEGEGRAA